MPDTADGMAGPTVTVRGEASIRTEPDEAFVWITLSELNEAPGSALADVASRSERLSELMDELNISREDRSTTGITVTEEFDHTSEGRRSLGHRAAATSSVRLADANLIGQLIMRASGDLDGRIAGHDGACPRLILPGSRRPCVRPRTRARRRRLMQPGSTRRSER
jgi:uncharacterized protein YggE